MKSKIQIKRTVIHSEYTLMDSGITPIGKIKLILADKHSNDSAFFELNQDEAAKMIAWILLSNEEAILPFLHELFKNYPKVKSRITEALLTFDTEAGGTTMQLEAAPAGKEEKS